MRFRTNLPVSCISTDYTPLNRQTFELCLFLEAGGTVRPIHVRKEPNGRWTILDGRHRLTAHKLLGRATIACTYGQPDPQRG